MQQPSFDDSPTFSGQFGYPPTPPPPPRRNVWHWYRRRGKATQAGIGCGLILILALCSCGSFAAIAGGNTSSRPSTSTIAQVATQSPTMAPTIQVTVITPVQPTPTPTMMPSPTPVPTHPPTPTPVPTHPPLPTPIPTRAPAPTQPPVVPTPKPQPPQSHGVNGNPWGYDFNPGILIYNPPANFCAYFNCIPSFWQHTNGYVDECNDGMYSHSGGRRGACSYHGGEMRPLYRH